MSTVTGEVWSFADVNASLPVGKQYDFFWGLVADESFAGCGFL